MEKDGGELSQRLQGLHARLVSTRRNASGRLVHHLQFASGESYAMFHGDVVELATGTVTLREIVLRNEGADLAGLWPGMSQRSPMTPRAPGPPQAAREPEDFCVIRAEAWDASLGLFASMVSDYASLGARPSEAQDATPRPTVRRRRDL